ncbi:MAG: PAS domain S-box protein [Desulfatiglandales bacterium]
MKDTAMTKDQLIAELRELRKNAAAMKKLERYKTICDRAGYGVVIRDLRGHLVYVNDAFARMHGYTSAELVGQHYAIMHTPEQVKHVDSLEKTRRLEGGFIAEIGHKRKDGTIFPTLMNGTMLVDEQGNHIYNTATAIDITELKRVEAELRRQIQRVERILETAMDGFLIIAKNGKVLDMNNSASTIFGYAREEMLSANIHDFGDPEDAKGNVRHFRTIMKQGFHRFEGKYRSREGVALYLECSANFVDMGEDSFFFVFFRDITSKKKTEEELKKRDKELERKNMELEEANTALRVLLKRRDRDKTELEEKVLHNVNELVEPVLERLRASTLNSRQQTYVSILESNLNDIVSPFARRLLHTFVKLTPTEIQIANFIREGKTTKEIGNLMNSSMRTIEFHRKNIRKKLGIASKRKNLRSHLLALH